MSKKPIKKLADLAKEALDMSKEARMARAAEMGFDTEKVFYRGLKTPHSDDAKTMLRGGAEETWLISNPKMAGEYAGDAAGANVVPAHLGLENPMVHDLNASPVEDLGEIVDEAKSSGHDGLILKGFDHRDEMNRVYSKGTAAVVFDKSKIRSTNAKFDPAKKKSGNILDSLGPIAVGAAGVGVASQDAEAKPISPSQLKKAAAAGYDAENILYHGSINKGVQEFVIDGSHSNFGQKAGPGTYLTPEKRYAEQYTQDNSGKTIGEVRKLVLPKGAVLDEYSNPGSLEKFYKDHGLNLKDLEFATKYTFDPSWAVWRGVRQKFPNLDEAAQIKKMQGMLEKSGYAAVAREGDAGVEYVVQRPQVLRDIEKAAFKDNKSANILAGGAGAATLAASNDALAADLNSPIASGMGEVASQAGHAMERFDAYTSNPFRKFLNSALEGKGIIQSARDGVAAIGAEKPTTGEEVAKNFLSLSPNQNLGFPTADGGKDYPLAGPLGVAVDFAVDPTNIPMAKAVGPSMDAASSISRIIEQSLLKRGLVLP